MGGNLWQFREATWELQAEELPLQHVAWLGNFLHLSEEYPILREPQGPLWEETMGRESAPAALSHGLMLTVPLMRPKVPGYTDRSYQLS